MKHFEMTDLFYLSSYLGIDVQQGETHISEPKCSWKENPREF